jgi:hypothetical protein
LTSLRLARFIFVVSAEQVEKRSRIYYCYRTVSICTGWPYLPHQLSVHGREDGKISPNITEILQEIQRTVGKHAE